MVGRDGGQAEILLEVLIRFLLLALSHGGREGHSENVAYLRPCPVRRPSIFSALLT